MAQNSHGDNYKLFLKTFRSLAPHKHRYEVFYDFVVMIACTLHNAVNFDQTREDEYLKIINGYDKPDRDKFPELFGVLVLLMEPEPCDVLGQLYMELEIASKDRGQFFTPQPLSDLMAELTMRPDLFDRDKDFITVSEPTCGAGGMVLAIVKMMIRKKLASGSRLWVQAIDIDRLAALMCYIQLTLWHVPAEVIVGDTLRWELREVWYTPAHYLGNWRARLDARADNESSGEEASEPQIDQSGGFHRTKSQSEKPSESPTQMGFDFTSGGDA